MSSVIPVFKLLEEILDDIRLHANIMWWLICEVYNSMLPQKNYDLRLDAKTRGQYLQLGGCL